MLGIERVITPYAFDETPRPPVSFDVQEPIGITDLGIEIDFDLFADLDPFLFHSWILDVLRRPILAIPIESEIEFFQINLLKVLEETFNAVGVFSFEDLIYQVPEFENYPANDYWYMNRQPVFNTLDAVYLFGISATQLLVVLHWPEAYTMRDEMMMYLEDILNIERFIPPVFDTASPPTPMSPPHWGESDRIIESNEDITPNPLFFYELILDKLCRGIFTWNRHLESYSEYMQTNILKVLEETFNAVGIFSSDDLIYRVPEF